MMKSLQKTIQLTFVLFCMVISNQLIAQTNLLTVSPSFESGSGVGPGSSLDGGSWARTGDTNAATYIIRQGLGNTTGAPAAYNGNYYLEAVTPNDATFNTHTKLVAGNSQNLINLGKGKTFRVFFHYQNSAEHSFRALVLTSNGATLNELVISDTATDWTEASFDYLIPASTTSTSASLRFEFGLNAGTTRVDNVRMYDLEALPVDLKSFNVTKSNNAAQLNWETVSEENNSHYEILRSANGKEFSKLKAIDAKNKAAIYSYEDKNPNEGINYYKLIQYDLDGTSKELGVKALNFSLKKSTTVAYPNPFSNEVTVIGELSATKNVSVSLIDSSGKLIKMDSFKGVAGLNSFKVQTNDLLPGIYTLLFGNEAVKVYKK